MSNPSGVLSKPCTVNAATRRATARGLLAVVMLIVAGSAMFTVRYTTAQQSTPELRDGTKEVPHYIEAKRTKSLQVKLNPVGSPRDAEQGGIAGVCPPISKTYTDFNWNCTQSCTMILQGGLVETEIAAASYTVPADQFPIKLEMAEMIFGTSNATIQTTTQWSLLVWDGPPNTGILVAEYSSDGLILPHIILPPGTTGMNVQVSVDPNDPEQIFIYNDSGTNKFSIGYRIDQHNNPPTATCQCIPPLPGNLPAVCCPPLKSSNAFPASDNSSLSNPSNNWLYARDCPGATGFCQASPGWHTNSAAGINHDWIIRATYNPINCAPPIGACCTPSGACMSNLSTAECDLQDGSYQGDGTSCDSLSCPQPIGACCKPNGTCSQLTLDECITQGGTYVGTDTPCDSNLCKGACCVPSTQACVFATQANCAAVGGVFQGFGVQCASVVCFPKGACCLPDGSCISTPPQTPAQCQAAGGVFQGNGTTCATVSCPIPEGACCFGPICLDQVTEADCTEGFGGVWHGVGSDCNSPSACSPQCDGDIFPSGGDSNVDTDDLLTIINSWGACTGCDSDIAPEPDGNNVVDVDDLLIVINGWGGCS